MKTFIRIIAVVLVLSALFFMKTRSSDDSVRVYRVSDGKTISYNEMISEVRNASLIFTGEIHTDQEHHRLELDIIKSLNKAKVPIAVGFEMFRADSQKYLDQWVKGVLPFDDFVRVYYRNWNMPWPLYGNILMYLRQEDIPAIGLNVPEGIARKVNTDGFSSLTQDERRMLPPGISCSVDEKYMEFIQRAYREQDDGVEPGWISQRPSPRSHRCGHGGRPCLEERHSRAGDSPFRKDTLQGDTPRSPGVHRAEEHHVCRCRLHRSEELNGPGDRRE
jgi:hypothetical protein